MHFNFLSEISRNSMPVVRASLCRSWISTQKGRLLFLACALSQQCQPSTSLLVQVFLIKAGHDEVGQRGFEIQVLEMQLQISCRAPCRPTASMILVLMVTAISSLGFVGQMCLSPMASSMETSVSLGSSSSGRYWAHVLL